MLRSLALTFVLLCGLSADARGQSPPEDKETPSTYPTRPSPPEPPKKIFIRRSVWVDAYRFTSEERVPLEAVTSRTEGVTGLTNIIPPADYLEAHSLSRRNRAGFEMDKFRYGSSLPVTPDTTFVMRSTSNRRADLLVAFRVIRLDDDGSITIAWQKLKSYPKPEWKRREP